MKKKYYLSNNKNYYKRNQIKIDKNNVLFLQYAIYVDQEEEINKHIIGKKLKDILEINKYIIVNDHFKIKKNNNYLNRIQFFTKKENISNDQIEKIRIYLENIK